MRTWYLNPMVTHVVIDYRAFGELAFFAAIVPCASATVCLGITAQDIATTAIDGAAVLTLLVIVYITFCQALRGGRSRAALPTRTGHGPRSTPTQTTLGLEGRSCLNAICGECAAARQWLAHVL